MYLRRLFYGSHSHLRVRKINEDRQVLTISAIVVRFHKNVEMFSETEKLHFGTCTVTISFQYPRKRKQLSETGP